MKTVGFSRRLVVEKRIDITGCEVRLIVRELVVRVDRILLPGITSTKSEIIDCR